MTDSASVSAQRLKLSFGVKINFILGLGLAILVGVGSLAYRSIETLVDTSRYEGTSLVEVGRLEGLIGALRRTESSQRKYLITGSAQDMSRYRAVRALVRFEETGLGSSGHDPTQQRRLKELQSAITLRLSSLDDVVDVRKAKGLAAAALVVSNGRAEELNLRIGMLADQFRAHEFRALRSRQAETALNAETTSFLVFWGIAFSMTLLVWAMVVIHRHQAGRQVAEQALRASEAQLRLITDAVPALIAYVDRNGNLQFHNRAFEDWFNRSASQLHQQSLRTLMGQEAYALIASQVETVLAGEAVSFDFSLAAVRGKTLDLSAQFVPRRDERGAVQGYYALVTDITALKQVDRMKSEFVTTVSHELRTPLTSIRGSLGLIAGGVTGVLSDKAKELVTIALQSCERLVRLINDILDSEKMLSGKMEFSLSLFNPVELIERSIRENESYAATHKVTVKLENQAASPCVHADPDRLVQVVTNLLSNACKFSPQGGVVEVLIERSASRVRVSVSDRGSGIPADLQGRLFERFAQLDSNDSRRRSGTGLGLSISKAIIERLGGSIAFSVREGGGSVFTFELPLAENEKSG